MLELVFIKLCSITIAFRNVHLKELKNEKS